MKFSNLFSSGGSSMAVAEEFLSLLRSANSGSYNKNNPIFSAKLARNLQEEWTKFIKNYHVDLAAEGSAAPAPRALAARPASHGNAHLMELNKTLLGITEMDSIKTMLDDVAMVSISVDDVRANTHEINESINVAAGRLDKLTNYVNAVSDNTKDSIQNMVASFAFINNSFNNIQELGSKIHEIHDSANNISHVIDIIRAVAEQTNLLALNAAIEAARAGEQGRGFSVVADEVRRLAENTQESVKTVLGTVTKLQEETTKFASTLNESTEELSSGKELIDSVKKSVMDIESDMGGITNEINEVAAIYEQQTAAINNVTTSVDSMVDGAHELARKCTSAGADFSKVSHTVNDMRLDILKESSHLSNNETIDIAITDHMLWQWRIQNMILGYERIEESSVGTHKTCRLGQWYYGNPPAEMTHNPDFTGMESYHEKMHRLAGQAVHAYNEGNVARAKELLRQVQDCSREIVIRLRNLQK